MKKITKAMYFEAIKGIIEGLSDAAVPEGIKVDDVLKFIDKQFPEGISADDVLDFIDKQVALLNKRASLSKERAANDELM